MSRSAPIILQHTDTECGVASLAMLFAYHGLHLSMEELRDQCMAGRDGCKAKTLIEVASSHGFKANAHRVEINTLRKLSSPVIAHWNFSHYVVINRIRKSKVYLNDPAFGAMTMSLEEFSRSFTGVIINLTPGIHFKKRKKDAYYFTNIRSLIHDHRSNLLFLTLCALVISAAPYFTLLGQKLIINQLSRHNDETAINIIVLCAGITAYLVTNYTQRITQLKISSHQTLTISTNAIHHLLKLPLSFYLLRQRSELCQITHRIESVIGALIKGSTDILTSTFAILFCFILIMNFNKWLLMLSLGGFIAQIATHFLLDIYHKANEQANIVVAAKRNGFTSTAIHQLETIHACSLQRSMTEKWQALLEHSLSNKMKLNRTQLLKLVFTKFHHAVIATCLLLTVARDYDYIIVYYAFHFILFHHTGSLLNTIGMIKRNAPHQQRLNDIATYRAENGYQHENKSTPEERTANTAISCTHLTYHHDIRQPPVLHHLTLSIRAREHVAFIGQTGAGKSTLVKLLCGLYQPTSGQITINDRPLTSYSAKERANTIAYVSQDSSLFSGTLLDNLLPDRPFNSEEINRAIFISCLDKFVSDRGLHAPIINGGDNISGGEKQRIDIARALLQKTPIIILDEATSALDETTQAELIHRLRSTDKTILFIAHRLSSIQHCDQVITLQHGKIIKHDHRIH